MGRDSVVGIVNRYGLDGPGFESQWGGGREFSHLSSHLYNKGWASFPGVGLPVRGVNLPPHLVPRLKKV